MISVGSNVKVACCGRTKKTTPNKGRLEMLLSESGHMADSGPEFAYLERAPLRALWIRMCVLASLLRAAVILMNLMAVKIVRVGAVRLEVQVDYVR